MTNKEALREIHRDHQKINRNLQYQRFCFWSVKSLITGKRK